MYISEGGQRCLRVQWVVVRYMCTCIYTYIHMHDAWGCGDGWGVGIYTCTCIDYI